MKYLYYIMAINVVLLLWSFDCFGQSFPASDPPSISDAVATQTSTVLRLPSDSWELTFEWIPELGSANTVTYPIKIEVPFEHDQGFIYIRAKKRQTTRSPTIGLPIEAIQMPPVSGPHYVFVYSKSDDRFLAETIPYDDSGQFIFYLPSWNQWYWIGLWSDAEKRYVFERWIGHFKSPTTETAVPAVP